MTSRKSLGVTFWATGWHILRSAIVAFCVVFRISVSTAGEPPARTSPLDALQSRDLPGNLRFRPPPELVAVLNRPVSYLYSVKFSADSKWLALGDGTRAVLYDTANLGTPLILKGHQGTSIQSLVFSPKSTQLASGDNTGQIRLWDLTQKTAIEQFRLSLASPAQSIDLAYAPDGQTLVACGAGAERHITVWDLSKEAPTLRGDVKHPPAAGRDIIVNDEHIAFAPDGKAFATWGQDISNGYAASESSRLTLWDASKLSEIASISLLRTPRAFAFSPDGRSLAVSDEESFTYARLALLDVKEKELVLRRALSDEQPRSELVYALSFGPDARRLITAQANGLVVVWDIATGKTERTIRLPIGVFRADLTQDGRYLAVANRAGSVLILRVASADRADVVEKQ
ncbi:MAG: WD40 repeat domain-containing protein [Deltaproteobacteria bacterium]